MDHLHKWTHLVPDSRSEPNRIRQVPCKQKVYPYQFRNGVPTHVVTLTQVGTSVYLGQTHMGTPFQVPAWVRKFSLGSMAFIKKQSHQVNWRLLEFVNKI